MMKMWQTLFFLDRKNEALWCISDGHSHLTTLWGARGTASEWTKEKKNNNNRTIKCTRKKLHMHSMDIWKGYCLEMC